jgi:ABC-2 type transport system ATP-binding protein
MSTTRTTGFGGDQVLNVRGVYKSYGETAALAGVDLTIDAGEICALLGPNGAGKTTLSSIVVGLLRPDRGQVTVAGIDVVRRPYLAREHIGYAPQELGVYPLGSVRDNLAYFGALAGLRGRTLGRRVEEAAELLGLTQLLGRQAGLMSGGEQRRLHTAMALLHRPKLLLLDEPTVGADVATRGRILDFVRTLADQGTAVCYTTHYLSEVEDIDATVALIFQGRIVTRGTVRQLIADHGDSYVELRFDGTVPRGRLTDRPEQRVGDTIRISSVDPAADAAAALRAAAHAGAAVQAVDFIRPSLDSVFLRLTGSRLDSDEETEEADVLAS